MKAITKLTMPRLNKHLVQREAPLIRLNGVFQTGFGVICAPAGYGKTTLVSQWLLRERKRYAWLSLDERDNDARYFWRGIRESLSCVFDRFSEPFALSGPFENESDVQSSIDSLVYDLTDYARSWSAVEHLVLVLDDFHVIKNPTIHRQLSLFIDDCPPFVKFVVSTRFEPHLHLSNRRVKGQLTELGSVDLAFDIDACFDLLQNQQAISLSQSELQVLLDKTEGWVAAIHLAALTLQQKTDYATFLASFSGNQKLLSAYLLEEVYSLLPEETKSTLLKMSVLPRFCADLIETIADTDGQGFIESMQKSSLLMNALDEDNEWFRFHDLFREWLLSRAEKSPFIDLDIVRQKAARWLECHGLHLDALEHILVCKDWPWASRVAGAMLIDITRLNEFSISSIILERFPPEFVCTQPKLCLLKASVDHNFNTLDSAIAHLTKATNLLTCQATGDDENRVRLGLLPDENINELLAYSYNFHSILAGFNGEHALSNQLVNKITEIPGVENFPLFSNALFKQGLDHFKENNLREAELCTLEAISHAKQFDNPGAFVRATYVLSGVYYHLGKHYLIDALVDEAEAWLTVDALKQKSLLVLFNLTKALSLLLNNKAKDALLLLESHDGVIKYMPPVEQIIAKYMKVIAFNFNGDFHQSLRLLDEINVIYRRHYTCWSFPQPEISSFRAMVQYLAGDEQALYDWSDSYEPESLPICPHAEQEQEWIYLFSQIAQGHDVRAEVKALRAHAQNNGAVIAQLRCWLFDVLYYGQKGKKIRSMNAFKNALRLGATTGVISVFLETGSKLLPLLEGAIKLRIETKFSTRLLGLIKANESQEPIDSNSPTPLALNPLSGRELELLKLINAGYSNKQIADATQITEGTVKVHLSNVYSKLSVKNRTQALSVAREHGLLQEKAS